MSLVNPEQMNHELLEEVQRLKHENRMLKEKHGLLERKIDVVIGTVKEGRVSIYFNDGDSWESQVPKVDGLGRYVEKGNERYYIQPMLSDFKTYVFSKVQAGIIRKSFRENGSGVGGYKSCIKNNIVCKNYLYKMYHDLMMKEFHIGITDEDEIKLLDLLNRDTGVRGQDHEHVEYGYSLELIKAIQKVLVKAKI